MNNIKFRKIKKEIRILGIDDGPFDFRKDKKTVIIGVMFRGGSFMDGVMKRESDVDGMDITRTIIDMLKKTRHKDLRIVMLDGITYAGFNIVNIREIFKETHIPVIVVVRKFPDFERIRNALKHLDDFEERWKVIEIAGKPKKVKVESIDGRKGFVYIQKCGINLSDAKAIVKISTTRGLIPEPIRLAHIIASGIVSGESRGNA
ncbi:MAG: DUF99 family protein [Candidatus Altiarchaeum hamiconexum]|uniref:UPF0215 protein GW779_01535 n=1 Tax=Candidatus Altarchaeum hamiconexum TaxID=1803513 RepID=A0A8J7Z141_9ARCH|nr:DUF99 family protein [Candidatus Altarchaeum hamiconexum]OIQ06205.1 MAG: hypothetical protein AUK59_00705 [Candidatus Altarchaeum sp. CG2_30_32_3053]PIN67359.1 MAG: hypothetical protein COV98_03305 [Candidatus Altarchaeum sp. CG12_big_fil_rev_8_21_14_0_65_33_22]PIV27286.1 MAG: hypothetical protein COS36_06285 [Candidatus Altarchaeum sp. CG03_land_8_20_14_0_80_32_618]PIX49342.1 MAG: hypothetical protein COZ53_00985 [Candidatus Altarchaeum sp. CG_4_8_14_3_um_filter_33_2054]PIZ29242.1 MAG: hyp